jgi:hypothetical protein
MNRIHLAVLAAACVALTSCEHVAQLRPDAAYVAGDRATFDAIAPTVRDLADGDPTNDPDLSGVNGSSLLLLIDSWEARLEAAEESLAP